MEIATLSRLVRAMLAVGPCGPCQETPLRARALLLSGCAPRAEHAEHTRAPRAESGRGAVDDTRSGSGIAWICAQGLALACTQTAASFKQICLQILNELTGSAPIDVRTRATAQP